MVSLCTITLEFKFTGAGSETITLNGTGFLNYLYDVTFDGSGSWTFTDSHATATGAVVIDNGAVTFPSSVLTIGDTLQTDGSFNSNGGTVRFISAESETITTNGSSFTNVVFGDGSLGWYGEDWTDRIVLTVGPDVVDADLFDYPLYVDLSLLGSSFWSTVEPTGADIRITSADGETELPFEIVSIDYTGQTGELHFLTPTISATASTTFYIYVGNADAESYAASDTYGSENVWTGYEAVYHFEDEPGSAADATANNRDMVATVGTPATTTGQIGKALDTTASSVMLEDNDWTWVSGDNLWSSGLYFQSATDNGALWQFGDGSGSNNGTYLAFLPDYDGNGGRHFFGITTGGDYDFTRDNGSWHHFTTIGRATDGEQNEIYEDDVLRDAVTQISSSQNPTNTGLKIGRYQTNTYMDVDVDELRFATTTPSRAWISFEYTNFLNPAATYSVDSESFSGSVTTYTLDEANVNVAGDLIVSGVRLVAPTDTLSIGGSALNTSGVFDPNNATTTFNSTDTGETFDFGDVTFYNLSFNGVGGGWTVSTTSVANNLSLVTGASFAMSPNTTLSVGGRFSNTFTATSTTWTDSTLVLTGGDYTVTDRLDNGDDYATLVVGNDTDIVLWNSTISTSTVRDTSSIYMPDFGGVDGHLRIYGDYERTSGNEYWSYATDFDGTDLTGGSERAVTVTMKNGSAVTIGTSSALYMLGSVGASTTVQVDFGIYDLELRNATLAAAYAELSGGGASGLELLDNTTVSTFNNVQFAVAAGRTGLTLDAATMNAQPSSEWTNIDFASTTGTNIYQADWTGQMVVTVAASAVDESLSDFPVYVDLSRLGADFWSAVNSNGSDIRITTAGGRELPIDLVEIDVSTETGELHFLADELSSVSDTAFYLHYGNGSAASYADSDGVWNASSLECV
ncbi:MAG: DUF2341 domain-containing protein [Candidatus Paceibacterota bacterium]